MHHCTYILYMVVCKIRIRAMNSFRLYIVNTINWHEVMVRVIYYYISIKNCLWLLLFITFLFILFCQMILTRLFLTTLSLKHPESLFDLFPLKSVVSSFIDTWVGDFTKEHLGAEWRAKSICPQSQLLFFFKIYWSTFLGEIQRE